MGIYRYGFNGKEEDNEIKGEGNQYDYGFRIYNPQIGRFLSTDPLAKKFAFYTLYQFSGNKPTVAVDLDGQEDHIYTISFFNKQGQAVFTSSHNEGNVIGIDRNGYEVYDRPEKFVAAYNIAFIDGTSYSLTQSFDSYKEMQGVKQSGFYSQAVSLSLYKGFDLGMTSFYGSELGYGLYTLSTKAIASRLARASIDNTKVASGMAAQASEPLQRITLKEPTLSADGALKGYVFNGTPEIGGVPAQLHGTFDFVVNDNVLTFGKRHTFLSMGAADVEAAGTFTFKQGKMVTVDNLSGHYFPSIDESMNFLKVLQKQGMNVEHATLKMYNTSELTGRLQLQRQVAPNAKDRSAFTLSL